MSTNGKPQGNGAPSGVAPELWRAYLSTTYRVHTPDGAIDLRIGNAVPELDRLLETIGESTWAFISAANPGSRRLSDAENDERHERLKAEVETLKLRVFEGEGIGSGEWPAERSLLIIGIGPADARELAKRFEQNAIVAGLHGGPPVLVPCSDELGPQVS